MITIQAGYAVVIDDEPANRDFLERLLATASFKVTGAASGTEGLKAAKAVPSLALALVDQELPDSTGLEIIAKLRADNPDAVLVMATMHDDRTLIDQAFEAGVDVFLVKPHGFMELYRRIQEVDSNASLLRRLVIDQYGPRPYKGSTTRTQEVKPTPSLPVMPAAASAPATPAAPTTVTPPTSTDPTRPSRVVENPAVVIPTPAPVVPEKTTTPVPPVQPANPPAPTTSLSTSLADKAIVATQPPLENSSSTTDPTIVRRPGDKPLTVSDATIPRKPKELNG
jgi:CheY-like chemotaxis protein